MRTVHKFELDDSVTTTGVGAVTKLQLPRSARPLAVQAQQNKAQIWVLLDPEQNTVERTFVMTGTGHPIQAPGLEEHIQEDYEYVDTFQLGAFVGHVWEVVEAMPF